MEMEVSFLGGKKSVQRIDVSLLEQIRLKTKVANDPLRHGLQ